MLLIFSSFIVSSQIVEIKARREKVSTPPPRDPTPLSWCKLISDFSPEVLNTFTLFKDIFWSIVVWSHEPGSTIEGALRPKSLPTLQFIIVLHIGPGNDVYSLPIMFQLNLYTLPANGALVYQGKAPVYLCFTGPGYLCNSLPGYKGTSVPVSQCSCGMCSSGRLVDPHQLPSLGRNLRAAQDRRKSAKVWHLSRKSPPRSDALRRNRCSGAG